LIDMTEGLPDMPGNTTDRVTRVITDLRPTTTLLHRQTASCSLSDRMAHFASPGVSIAVVDEGRVAWERGFGVRTNSQAEPVGADTLFQAGSVSKAVFALGAMRLVQQGRIALDSDVQQYLTSWRIPSNGDWAPRVTLRQLLSHTAGVSVHGFVGYPATGPWPTVTQTLNGSPPANNFPIIVDLIPGLQFRYSGGGTTIAQAAVTDVLGHPLPEIMRELIFDPLGLADTTFAQPLPPDLAARSATAHPWNGVPMPGRWRVHPEIAAAGLWTTAGDLARIGCAFLDSLQGDHSPLGLSRKSSAAMLEPQLPTNLQNGDFVGLGWHCAGEGDAFHCHHLGWNEGFVAGLWLYPALGKGAAIMINSNQGWPLRDEIKEAIGREYNWPKPPSKTILQQLPTALAGTYHTERGVSCEVAIDGTTLTLRINKQSPIAFMLQEAGFVSSSVNASLQFLPTMEAADSMVLNQAGQTFRFEK
jgi:CubicO group peptidase (beta-lactamase class C family)